MMAVTTPLLPLLPLPLQCAQLIPEAAQSFQINLHKRLNKKNNIYLIAA